MIRRRIEKHADAVQETKSKNAKHQVIFFVAGNGGYFVADAGKFAADAIFIAADGGKRIRQQQKR